MEKNNTGRSNINENKKKVKNKSRNGKRRKRKHPGRIGIREDQLKKKGWVLKEGRGGGALCLVWLRWAMKMPGTRGHKGF